MVHNNLTNKLPVKQASRERLRPYFALAPIDVKVQYIC